MDHKNLVKGFWFIFVKVKQQWSKLVEKFTCTATVSENSLKEKHFIYEYFSFQNMCISVNNKLNCLNRWFVFTRRTSNSSLTLNLLVVVLSENAFRNKLVLSSSLAILDQYRPQQFGKNMFFDLFWWKWLNNDRNL